MIYDTIDAKWYWNGDYGIGSDGDLADTSADLLESLQTEVRTVVKSETGDWELHPALAATFSDFKGEPNTPTTAELLRQRIISSLTNNNIVKAEDLQVRIVPVHVHQVLVILRIQVTATPDNQLKVGEPVVISVLYDSSENDIFFLPPNQREREALR